MPNVIGVGQLSLLDLNDAIVSGTPPANPTVGALWIDESSNPNLLKKWNGSQWEVLGELDPNLSVTISDIQETLGNMANDNILDVNERQVIKDKLTEILGYVIVDTATTLPTDTTLDSSGKGGFYTVRRSALAAGIPATDPKYTAVATKYMDLKVYLEGLTPIKPWDTSTTNKDVVINVDKATFRDKWLQYYNAVNDLATATAQKLKENVDNVTVGGTNYASNGDFSIALNKGLWANHYVGSVKEIVDISTEEPPFQFALHIKNTSNINGGIFTPILWSGKMAESLIDKEVTISFWLKYQNIVQGSQSWNIGHFGELVIEGEKADGTKVYSYPRVLYISGTNMTWQKYSATFKLSLPSGAVKLTKISFKHGLEGCQGEFWTTGIKIEFGNKATDWSPCPFDIQDRLTKAEFKIEDDRIVSVVTSSQTYVNTINSLQADINTANSKIDSLGTRVNSAETSITQLSNQITLKANATDVYTKQQVDASLANKADKTEVDSLETRVSNAEAQLTVQANQIATKVSQTEFTQELSKKENAVTKSNSAPSNPSTNQLWLDTSVTPNVLKRWNGSAWVKATPTTAGEVGAYSKSETDSKLGTKANQSDLNTLTTRVSTAESSITQLSNQITLKANASDVYTKQQVDTSLAGKADVSTVSAIEQRVSQAEAQLTVQAGQIATKVSKTEFETLESNAIIDRGSLNTSTDWNTLKQSGIYRTAFSSTKPPNFPSGAYGYGLLLVEKTGSTVTQTYKSHTGQVYTRQTWDGTDQQWKSWTKIEDTAGSQAKVDALKTSEIEPLKTRVSSAETSITQLSNQIQLKANQSTVDTIAGQVNNLQAQLTVQAGQIATKVSKTEFESLQIGGRNYLLNSENEKILRSYTLLYNLSDDKHDLANAPAIVSFEARHDEDSSPVVLHVYYRTATGDNLGHSYGDSIETSTDYKRFVIPIDSDKIPSDMTPYVTLTIRKNDNVNTVYIRKVKLERGNRATDWTPAPEDVQGQIDGLGTRVNSAESSITQLADQIALKVEKNGVISAINQTPESIKIQASKVDLSGYVTFTNLSTAGQTIIDGGNLKANSVAVSKLASGTINADIIGIANSKIRLNNNGLYVYKNGVESASLVEGNLTFNDQSNGQRIGRFAATVWSDGVTKGISMNMERDRYISFGHYLNSTVGYTPMLVLNPGTAMQGVPQGIVANLPIRMNDDLWMGIKALRFGLNNTHNHSALWHDTGNNLTIASYTGIRLAYLTSGGVANDRLTVDENSVDVWQDLDLHGWKLLRVAEADFISTARIAYDSSAVYVQHNTEVRATRYRSTTYVPVRAASFPTGSLAEYKQDIHVWEESALEKIRNATIYEYRLKSEVEAGRERWRQGLVIGDGYNTPEGVVDGDGVEQYLMNAWSWKAIQELDSIQANHGDRIAWLELENQYLKQKNNQLEQRIAKLEEVIA